MTGYFGTSEERRFYLDQFRGRLLIISDPTAVGVDGHESVTEIVDELVANGAVVVRTEPSESGVLNQLGDEQMIALWRDLDAHGVTTVAVPDADASRELATQIAERFRAHKLVLVTRGRDRADTGGRVDESYISIDIDETHDGAVELAARALRSGVASVNVVHVEGLADELLTYRGAGTLYTAGDYVTIDRVGFDDFAQVQRLIRTGVEAGFLKPRSDAEIHQLVVNGYGARVDGSHVGGFAALLTEPYAANRIGEITALATISRFSGGGVGSRLVQHLLQVARGRGLSAVFATTSSDEAASFFTRLGFVEVDDDVVPGIKWERYDPTRRMAVRSFWFALGG